MGLSLAFASVVAEIVVRMVAGSPLPERLPIMEIQSNRHRGWMMVPGRNHYTYEHLVHINSLGLRGPEVQPRDADSHTRRVLALGDSLCYGQGVADDETIPHYVQEMLNAEAQGTAWEVINAGHRAYDTRQELGLLEELGAQLAPDVVVIFWYWNDLLERDIAQTYERLRLTEPIAFDVSARMEGWEEVKWHLRQIARHSALLMYAYDHLGPAHEPFPTAAEQQDAFGRLDRHLTRFTQLARERHFQLCFAITPDPNLIAGEHPSAALAKRAADIAQRHGLTVVDLLPAVQAVYRETGDLPILPYDGHFRAEGNEAMAALVAEELRKLPAFR